MSVVDMTAHLLATAVDMIVDTTVDMTDRIVDTTGTTAATTVATTAMIVVMADTVATTADTALAPVPPQDAQEPSTGNASSFRAFWLCLHFFNPLKRCRYFNIKEPH